MRGKFALSFFTWIKHCSIHQKTDFETSLGKEGVESHTCIALRMILFHVNDLYVSLRTYFTHIDSLRYESV